MAGPDSTKFTYSSPIPKGCPPGKLGLTLFCPVSVPDIYSSKITYLPFRRRHIHQGFSSLTPVKYDPLICYFNQTIGKVQIRDKPSNLLCSAYLAIYSPWMCEYFNLVAVRGLWLTGTSIMLKSSYVPVELGKPPSLTIVISTGRNHIDRLTVKLSSSVTFRCQDVVLLEGKDETFSS